MTSEQKDLTSPTKTDANQNKEVKKNPIDQKKEDHTSEKHETNEKVKPAMGGTDKEREDIDHPHKSSEPVAAKEDKSSK